MTYLDHAATTPMLPEAAAAMTAHLTEAVPARGNASSLHTSGRRARRAIEEARENIADALGARPSEVLFTGGGTESDNLAVKGVYWASGKRRVLASAVEHHAVLDAVEWLEAQGADVTWLPTDSYGRVSAESVAEALDDDVALVTTMWANNEVGTINPVHDIAAVCAARGVPFHTDAVQAVGAVPVDFAASGASALTMTGHKVGGPYGVGVLLLARDVKCAPLMHGGGQERDVRSGTLDVPSVVGLARAVRLAVEEQAQRFAEITELREELITSVRAVVPDVIVNGDPVDRLPGNAHLTFPGCEGDSLLMLLDARGVECSTGSACTAGVAQPSHVLLAMGVEPSLARGSLRFSLGHTSTRADVEKLVSVIGPVVERARTAGLAGMRRSRKVVKQ